MYYSSSTNDTEHSQLASTTASPSSRLSTVVSYRIGRSMISIDCRSCLVVFAAEPAIAASCSTHGTALGISTKIDRCANLLVPRLVPVDFFPDVMHVWSHSSACGGARRRPNSLVEAWGKVWPDLEEPCPIRDWCRTVWWPIGCCHVEWWLRA